MRDLRFALKLVVTHPWFSFAVILTLAVGIGINATVFTLGHAVLLKPLPFRNGPRMVILSSTNTTQPDSRMDLSYPDLEDIRRDTRSFEAIGTASMGPAVLSETDRPPERFRIARVTANLFSMVGTEPALGRAIGPADEQPDAPAVLVIGYNVWRNRYGLSPDAVGKVVRVDQTPATIIGVMPQGFGFPNREDLWTPFTPSDAQRTERASRFLMTIGLLQPGVSWQAAEQDVSAIASRLRSSYPDTNKDIGARLLSFNERFNGGPIRTIFYLMLGAVGLVLLIACANVANMMLSRALMRQREMSIRSALGASRWQMVRQLLVESLVLSGAGGLVALLVASFGIRAFDRAVANAGKPSWIIFEIDYTVLGYLAGVCIASALIFGLVPALRSSRVDLNHVLKEGGRAGSGRVGWLASVLVVLQFTFAVVLLAAAGLMMRSFMAGESINPWLPASQVMVGRVELPTERYADKAARVRFYDTALTRLATLPGVKVAAAASGLPGSGGGQRRLELEGSLVANPPDRISTPSVVVSPGYFASIDLPLVRGRTFGTNEGDPGSEAAIVSRTFAARHWPNQDALGKRLRFNNDQKPEPWMTVVGVTGDLVHSTQQAEAEPVVFVPYRQTDSRSLVFALRSAAEATPLVNPLRTAVQSLDGNLPLFDADTYENRQYIQRWPYRVFGTIFGIFAIAALLMASVGLYAVMSQATGRRTREIGIRMALGATPARILRVVMRTGAIQLGLGLVLGIGAALAVTGQMRSLLIGVVPSDPMTMAASSVVLLTVGLLACWIPARRAALIAPVRALATDDRQ